MCATRRGFLRSVGVAVGTVASLATGEPDADVRTTEGYVFYPETYRARTPFRLLAVSDPFWTRLGRGPTACNRENREYVAYPISYRNVETDTRVDGPISTFLAVSTPDEGGQVLPHRYFGWNQRFQFVSSDGEFVFHARCSESPTPIQHAVVAPVE